MGSASEKEKTLHPMCEWYCRCMAAIKLCAGQVQVWQVRFQKIHPNFLPATCLWPFVKIVKIGSPKRQHPILGLYRKKTAWSVVPAIAGRPRDSLFLSGTGCIPLSQRWVRLFQSRVCQEASVAKSIFQSHGEPLYFYSRFPFKCSFLFSNLKLALIWESL